MKQLPTLLLILPVLLGVFPCWAMVDWNVLQTDSYIQQRAEDQEPERSCFAFAYATRCTSNRQQMPHLLVTDADYIPEPHRSYIDEIRFVGGIIASWPAQGR